MAPRRRWIDRNLLKDMCLAQCSNEEIANALRTSWDTLQRRYAEAIKVWRAEGPMSARRRLFTLGMRDDPVFNKDGVAIGYKPASVPSLIFYLKNYGGMADVVKEAGKGLDSNGLPIPDEFRHQSQGTNKPN
jgi:hypothetical protein